MTTSPYSEPPASAPCACGHSPDEHDSLAARYCRATAAAGLDRGCMCVLVPAPSSR